MEDNLKFLKMEDDIDIFLKGRRPQFFFKMEDNLIQNNVTKNN